MVKLYVECGPSRPTGIWQNLLKSLLIIFVSEINFVSKTENNTLGECLSGRQNQHLGHVFNFMSSRFSIESIKLYRFMIRRKFQKNIHEN